MASTLSPARTKPCPNTIISACSPRPVNQTPSVSLLMMLIGVSIGISQPQDRKIETKKLLEQADQALYKAKERGKGCFVFS